MKTLLFLLGLLLSARTTFSQDLMKLEDSLTTSFDLTKMTVIQTDKIKHSDPTGVDNTYFAKVTFGKRRFDIEIYETATEKLLCTFYPMLQGSDYFKKDLKLSNSTTEVYTVDKNIRGGKEKCKVTFSKRRTVTVTISYSTQKTGQPKPDNVIVGSCEL